MAHFRATVGGNRGIASRLGSIKSGIAARVSGWQAGVSIEASRVERDVFRIIMTSGSSGRKADKFIGTVQETPDGPVFYPAQRNRA